MTGPGGARSGPGASLSSVRTRALVTVTGLLAVAAGIVVVVSDDARWLRLAVVAALWATLLVVVTTGRRVPQEASDGLRESHEEELADEVAARSAEQEELTALRDEVEHLRAVATRVAEPRLRVVGGTPDAFPPDALPPDADLPVTRPSAVRAARPSAAGRPRAAGPPEARPLRPVPPPAGAPAPAARSTPAPAPAPAPVARSTPGSAPAPAPGPAPHEAAPIRPLRSAGPGWGTGPGGAPPAGFPAGPGVVPAAGMVPPPPAPGTGEGSGYYPVAPQARAPEWSDPTGRSFTEEPPRTGGTGSRTVAELIAAHAAERDERRRR